MRRVWSPLQMNKLIPETSHSDENQSCFIAESICEGWTEEIGISLKKMRKQGREETVSLLNVVGKPI